MGNKWSIINNKSQGDLIAIVAEKGDRTASVIGHRSEGLIKLNYFIGYFKKQLD